MKNKLLRANNAITLISLVITIIVLLLLVGISISMLSGQDGILNKATKARNETKEAEKMDEIRLAIQEALVNGEGTLDFKEDGSLEKALEAKYGEEAYKGDGVVKIDEQYYTITETGGIVEGRFKVGDNVTYSPSGSYTWNKDYSGSNVEESPVLSSADEGEYRITTWKIFNINDDGTIDLISEMPTTGIVELSGYQGYNNIVKLLNDACSALYGNEEKGIKARSIKLEDIESKMTKSALKTAYSYVNAYSGVKYGMQLSTPYIDNKYYPAIYASEKLSVIDGVKNTTGLSRSEQEEFIEKSSEKIATTSIQPYQTHYNTTDATTTEKIFKGEGIGTSNTNYNLIIPSVVEDGVKAYKNYFVASRNIAPDTDKINFSIFRIYNGALFGRTLYYSSNLSDTESHSLRPIISIDSKLLKGTEVDGEMTWTIE